MLESFNYWFSRWEWSLALICAISVLSLAICALALAISLRGGGGGGGSKGHTKRPKPTGGIRVRMSKDFIRFMNRSIGKGRK